MGLRDFIRKNDDDGATQPKVPQPAQPRPLPVERVDTRHPVQQLLAEFQPTLQDIITSHGIEQALTPLELAFVKDLAPESQDAKPRRTRRPNSAPVVTAAMRSCAY